MGFKGVKYASFSLVAFGVFAIALLAQPSAVNAQVGLLCNTPSGTQCVTTEGECISICTDQGISGCSVQGECSLEDDTSAGGPAAQSRSVCAGDTCDRDEVGRFMEGVAATCYEGGNCKLRDIEIVMANVAEFALAIVGSLAFLMYVVGGIMWLTSAGNQERVQKGKDMIKYATLGLIIVLVAYTAVRWITIALGLETSGLSLPWTETN